MSKFKNWTREELAKKHPEAPKQLFTTLPSSVGMPIAEGKAAPEKKRSKYGNKKVITENEGTFDSKKEYGRWLELKQMLSEEKITILGRQATFPITVMGHEICKYKADFVYWKNGQFIVEDVKGMKKGSAYSFFRIKKKLMFAVFNIDVQEI